MASTLLCSTTAYVQPFPGHTPYSKNGGVYNVLDVKIARPYIQKFTDLCDTLCYSVRLGFLISEMNECGKNINGLDFSHEIEIRLPKEQLDALCKFLTDSDMQPIQKTEYLEKKRLEFI